jgi:hypothetical protein
MDQLNPTHENGSYIPIIVDKSMSGKVKRGITGNPVD